MPGWFGDALGSAIGLVAILLGALYNAKLTRERDDKIMDKEARSIAAAIGAELSVHIETLAGRYWSAFAGPEGQSHARLDSIRQPAPVVWPKIADQIGKLDYEISHKAVKAWSLLDLYSSLLDATVAEMKTGEWDEHKVRSRTDSLKRDLPFFMETIKALTGHDGPDLQYSLP